MKLIILHHYGDGYTYYGTDTLPIERESEEALLCELEDWANSDDPDIDGWCNTGIYSSAVLGTDANCSVEIMTLDKWFSDNEVL